MARLSWAMPNQRIFETGVDRGVLYPRNEPGVPWSGLQSIVETPTGGALERAYMDGQQIYQRRITESLELTLEALTYPDEFVRYDGFSESSTGETFDLAYRTLVGNFEQGVSFGYRLHLIYGVIAEPSGKSHISENADTEVVPFSWTLVTTPRKVSGFHPSSHLIIDTTLAWHEAFEAVEDVLYGTASNEPRMPTPEEVQAIFENYMDLRIIDHGDGTWTAISDDRVRMLSDSSFEIESPTAIFLTNDTYTVSNY